METFDLLQRHICQTSIIIDKKNIHVWNCFPELFFHFEVEKYSTPKWGKDQFWYYPRKNVSQTSTIFVVTGLLPNKIVFIIATPCIIK